MSVGDNHYAFYLGEFYSLEDSLEEKGQAKPGEFVDSLGSHFMR